MSMEQPRNQQGQYVSWEKYVETLINERWRGHEREHELIDRALGEAERLREKAISKAREVVDDRLGDLNNLHRQVLTDRGKYVTVEAMEHQVATLQNTIRPLQEFKDKALGFGALVSVMSAVFGSLITAVVLGLF